MISTSGWICRVWERKDCRRDAFFHGADCLGAKRIFLQLSYRFRYVVLPNFVEITAFSSVVIFYFKNTQ